MILLPRLERHEVDQALSALRKASADPEQARQVVAELGLRPHWNRSGGTPATDDLRTALAERLRQEAMNNGFPRPPDLKAQQAFDRAACRILAADSMLAGAGGDTLRAACWAGLTVLDHVDLVIWRFGGSAEKLSEDRLHGGVRNFLRRLWLRVRVLHLEGNGEADPWLLIDKLTEDAFVALIERTSIAADRRTAQAIAMEWVRRASGGQSMEAAMREVAKRIRATGEVRMLSVLSDEDLRSVVVEAFDRALGAPA